MILSPVAHAQDSTRAPLPLVGEAYLAGGVIGHQPAALTLDEWRTLAPSSSLLARDLTDHNFHSDTKVVEEPSLSGGIILNLRRSQLRRPGRTELRIGFQWTQGIVASGYGWRTDRTPYDTLTSSQTGQTYVVDSMFSSMYGAELDYDQLGLDVSVVFHSISSSRWGLYAGGGLSMAFRFNSAVSVFHSTDSSIDGPYDPAWSDRRSYDSESETIRTANGSALAAYGVLGLDFHTGVRSEFWRKLHLFYEMRPTLTYENIPEVGGFTGVGLQHVFGLRVALSDR